MLETPIYSTFSDATGLNTLGIETTGFVETTSTVLPNVDISLLPTENARGLDQYFPFFSGFSDAQILGLVFLALIWILTIFWVLRDAMARSNS